ncbi:hypothetical protein FACS1894132_09670 [Clostridia bacterium]|nr:hypothetical protein FACS1894132_09670 [Clostridia bacterium]
MNMSETAFWTMPFGLFLDLWECHKQYIGISKLYIDETEEFEALELDGE